MAIRPLDRILAADPALQPVLARARRIDALAKLCFEYLPPELAGQVAGVSLRDDRLLLTAVSPAAAAKLKLLAEPLAAFMAKQGAKVTGVSLRVQPRTGGETGARAAAPRAVGAGMIDAFIRLYNELPDSPTKVSLHSLLVSIGAFPTPRPSPGTAPQPSERG